MGKWLERLKQKLTHAPSGAGSKGSKADEIQSNHLEFRQTEDAGVPRKNKNMSGIEGSKGPKGGSEPFEPLPTRPFANHIRGTGPQDSGPPSTVDPRQITSLTEWAVLESWLEKLSTSDLPPVPFALDTARTVVDKTQYLTTLKREADLGPTGPRARSGAFQAECRKLRAVLDAVPESVNFSERESASSPPREGVPCI